MTGNVGSFLRNYAQDISFTRFDTHSIFYVNGRVFSNDRMKICQRILRRFVPYGADITVSPVR